MKNKKLNPKSIEKLLVSCRAAAGFLRTQTKNAKNGVLQRLADSIKKSEAQILKANAQDLKSLPRDVTPAFRDRLTLNSSRIDAIVESLQTVISLQDSVGEEVEKFTLPNGLKVRRVRSPLGVIFVIFESRPNVAIEAFAIGFKAGNAMILRGGKESKNTIAVFYKLIEQSLKAAGFPQHCIWGITDPDRTLARNLLKQNRWIDVVVPRGGDQLIKFVVEESRIPIIKNDRGLCHMYVHEDSDLDMALKLLINAKTQRPGVCNAVETLLVHQAVATSFISKLFQMTESFDLELRMCTKSRKVINTYLKSLSREELKGISRSRVRSATAKDWDTEHLDLILNCKIVGSIEEALAHIESFGSKHSEAIVTQSPEAARHFQGNVDAAVVYWNSSTRFTDGFELGLGGEIGVSTQKLHVRGPVGMRDLTGVRWVVDGYGQTRG